MCLAIMMVNLFSFMCRNFQIFFTRVKRAKEILMFFMSFCKTRQLSYLMDDVK